MIEQTFIMWSSNDACIFAQKIYNFFSGFFSHFFWDLKNINNDKLETVIMNGLRGLKKILYGGFPGNMTVFLRQFSDFGEGKFVSFVTIW